MRLSTQQHQPFSSTPSQGSVALIFVAISNTADNSSAPWLLVLCTPTYWLKLYLFSTECYPAYHLSWASAAVTLVSAKDEWEEKSWSCEPIPSHHLKKAINYQWSKSYRGTAFRHYSTEKTFSWDCLGRSLPQLQCWRVACVGKKRIKSRETAGLHDNNVYEAQRVMVIRNGWKATWGLDEKTALKKKERGREISCWTETLLL